MSFKVEDVWFSYGNRMVLKGVSFELKSGLAAIIGPNGAGKSTLLKCIVGFLKPSRGRIYLDEEDIASLPRTEVSRLLGYVPQRSYPSSLTVFDSVLMGRMPYMGWRVRDEDLKVVEEVLELFGLKKLACRRVNSLSGGEFQKVAIARAVAQRPRVLLLDEPTSSLDIKSQRDVMDVVSGLSGILVLLVTHDISLALRYAKNVVVLKDGELIWVGPTEDLEGSLLSRVYGVSVDIERIRGRFFVFS